VAQSGKIRIRPGRTGRIIRHGDGLKPGPLIRDDLLKNACDTIVAGEEVIPARLRLGELGFDETPESICQLSQLIERWGADDATSAFVRPIDSLLGVPLARPPRRSPGADPRGIRTVLLFFCHSNQP
jgi:hypothetical protein